jgi:hypothetical protein
MGEMMVYSLNNNDKILCNISVTDIKDILLDLPLDVLELNQKRIEHCYIKYLVDNKFFAREWEYRDRYNDHIHLSLNNRSDCDYEWHILKIIHETFQDYDDHWYTMDIEPGSFSMTTGEIDKIKIWIHDDRLKEYMKKYGIIISKDSLIRSIDGYKCLIDGAKKEIDRCRDKILQCELLL